jgi:hypothetical protein
MPIARFHQEPLSRGREKPRSGPWRLRVKNSLHHYLRWCKSAGLKKALGTRIEGPIVELQPGHGGRHGFVFDKGNERSPNALTAEVLANTDLLNVHVFACPFEIVFSALHDDP